MSRHINTIDQRHTRYRNLTHELAHIARHITQTDPPTPDLTPPHRETPDRTQALGIPLLIMPTPAWHRQPWHEPQTHPSVRPIVA